MPKKHNIFYDFEFLEDGRTIEPISLGMVIPTLERELYIVFNDFDTRRVARHNWLMDNVMTSIAHDKFVVSDFEGHPMVRDIYITEPGAMSKTEARVAIDEFLVDVWPKFWNWYGAYDHVALGQVYGPMIEWPDKFPMFSNDIKMLCNLAGNPEMPKQPSGLHNALDDARWNVVRYEYVTTLLRDNGTINV
jgi:hypothetical protein